MVAMQAKAGRLRQQAEERQLFRESAEYSAALQLLGAETCCSEPLHDMRGHLTREVIDDLGATPA
jgi:hypothetical protein